MTDEVTHLWGGEDSLPSEDLLCSFVMPRRSNQQIRPVERKCNEGDHFIEHTRLTVDVHVYLAAAKAWWFDLQENSSQRTLPPRCMYPHISFITTFVFSFCVWDLSIRLIFNVLLSFHHVTERRWKRVAKKDTCTRECKPYSQPSPYPPSPSYRTFYSNKRLSYNKRPLPPPPLKNKMNGPWVYGKGVII